MKISELVAALNKASQLVGDAPVILKALEGDAETAFKSIEATINIETGQTGETVTVTHGTPSPAPQADPATEQAAGTASAGPSA